MSESSEKEGTALNKPTIYFMSIAGAVLAAALAFIIFGLKNHVDQPLPTVDYNYFTFTQVGGLWQTDIQLKNKLYTGIFRYNPEQVQDVYVMGNFTGFVTKPIYITFDPNASPDDFKYLALASSELSLNLIRALNFTVTSACTENITDACIDRPIVRCGDANKSVIYLVPLAPTQITLSGSCVELSGEKLDLLKPVDRMLFQWYRIFDPNHKAKTQ